MFRAGLVEQEERPCGARYKPGKTDDSEPEIALGLLLQASQAKIVRNGISWHDQPVFRCSRWYDGGNFEKDRRRLD